MRLPIVAALAVALASLAARVDAADTTNLAASVTSHREPSPPTSLDISAAHVDYFSDKFVVTADGNVRVRLSDGTVLRGETFSMDLKLNRYLVAGDVHLDTGNVHEVGAAFAGYPDLDRSYFLPAAETPDRWTYFGRDWEHPHLGREQPGDAFYFPDLSGQRPYIVAKTATIIPKTNVTFSQAGVRTLNVYVPTPRYVVTFSPNPHFAENAFFGARLNVAEPYNGSAHSLSALHLRNDPVNGTYVAFDQHFVWPQDWIVFSIDPLTQEQRQYNLIGYKRISPKVEFRTFFQLSEGQPGGPIGQPINAASYANVQINAALRRSGIGLNFDQYNYDLLGVRDVAYDMQFFKQQLEHPMDMSLSWTGFENAVWKGWPLYFRLRSGTGYAHDQFGYGGYPNEPAPENAYYKYFGGTLYTPSLKLGKYSFTTKFDKQRTYFSLPHHTDVTDVTASLGRQYQHLNAYVLYDVSTTGDYWGAQQLQAYPQAPNTIVTPFGTYSGQSAFRGFGTAHTWASGLVFSPTPYFTLSMQVSRHYDTPAPVPGAYGQPPWQLAGDIRFRLAKNIGIDLTRAYYFNFANLRWTPQFGIQVTP